MRILIFEWHWSTAIVQAPNVVVSIWHICVHACRSFNVPDGRTVKVEYACPQPHLARGPQNVEQGDIAALDAYAWALQRNPSKSF